MHEAPVYPLVIAPDSGEFFGCASLERVQADVSIVGVEMDEYEAWDALGRRLQVQFRPDVVHSVGATQAIVDLFWWLLSFLRPRGRATVQVDDDDRWLDILVMSPEPDRSLLPRLRSYLAARGHAANDDATLASLIAQLMTLGER